MDRIRACKIHVRSKTDMRPIKRETVSRWNLREGPRALGKENVEIWNQGKAVLRRKSVPREIDLVYGDKHYSTWTQPYARPFHQVFPITRLLNCTLVFPSSRLYVVLFFGSSVLSSYLPKRKDRSQIKKRDYDPREWLSPTDNTNRIRDGWRKCVSRINVIEYYWSKLDINV